MNENYKNTERGDRLNPKRTNSRYWILTSLRNTLINIIETSVNGSQDILDYGCGNKPYKVLFKDNVSRYVGADLKPNDIAEIILNPDGTVPIEDSKFSLVISSQVLEHTLDPHIYLKEAYRVLKNDGMLIISTHGFWVYHPDPNDYWRWTGAGLKKIIQEAGFYVENIYSVVSLPSISLQLWQDATMNKVPRIFRRGYTFFIQLLMQILDKRNFGKFFENAGVFIIVAKK